MNGTGFFGGTFNPVHQGHIHLASWLREHYGLEEVWLSLSPQNPLKDTVHPGATDAQRLEMLRLACDDVPGIVPWAGELSMPRPSYTVDVLHRLSNLKPRLIIGSDNWLIFTKWYKYDEILKNYSVIVYPRPGYEIDPSGLPSNVIYAADAPVFDISSTQIRSDIKKYLNLLPPNVAEYIKQNKLYGYTEADK